MRNTYLFLILLSISFVFLGFRFYGGMKEFYLLDFTGSDFKAFQFFHEYKLCREKRAKLMPSINQTDKRTVDL